MKSQYQELLDKYKWLRLPSQGVVGEVTAPLLRITTTGDQRVTPEGDRRIFLE